MNLNEQVQDLKNDWEMNERWTYVKRPYSAEEVVKLKEFMSNANSNETLHEVLKKLAFDFKLQGAFALNVVWSHDRSRISEIYHIVQ